MALIQAPSRAALEHIQAERPRAVALRHDLGQHLAAKTSALMGRSEIEVFEPQRIGLRPECHEPDVVGVDLDHAGVCGNKRVKKALADTALVVTTESFEVGSHDFGSQLRHPVRVGGITGPERPFS
ncbi:MAG: hypothetical protein JWP75_1673 [Frondihabitans sp.]|nr:hypothetical protein [Frondihabitans sp.]